jgi:hypothetical protein
MAQMESMATAMVGLDPMDLMEPCIELQTMVL